MSDLDFRFYSFCVTIAINLVACLKYKMAKVFSQKPGFFAMGTNNSPYLRKKAGIKVHNFSEIYQLKLSEFLANNP
ncbi:MAG: hypothetical protein F6K35_24275 [Okeania sp. SIO2H7]|nr:hypothetical protein [Okeania sp. SIO2H7]